jgi:CheY-like chemotaxis protein
MPSERLRVLLVEDDPTTREITMTALRKAGLDVQEARSGEEALHWLMDPPDVLFTDIRLPGGIDGWQIAERFRAIEPKLPVIYATAYRKTQAPVSGSLFFRKPYKAQQVLLAIRAMTGGRARARESHR